MSARKQAFDYLADVRNYILDGWSAQDMSCRAEALLEALTFLKMAEDEIRNLSDDDSPRGGEPPDDDGGGSVRELATALARSHHGKGADQ